MKTWLSIFLPDDEYKRQQILIYIAEGAALTLIAMVISLLIGPFELSLSTLLFIMIFVSYVMIRYIGSGIEYTDVSNQKVYEKERKAVLMKSISFGVLFIIIMLAFEGTDDLLQSVMTAVLATIFYFLLNFISLKRSYSKNRELAD